MIALPAALLLMAAPPAGEAAAAPPAAAMLWSIGSDDCVSVDTDGDPWKECGFQAFAATSDLSRTLTVSTNDLVQLWDESGREIRRIDWKDEPSGASGYPTARVLIVGALGVVVVHQNQLMVIDLKDGAVLARRILEAMTVEELRLVGADRVFAQFKDREWELDAGEILLPSGALRALPGVKDLGRTGTDYWVTGSKAPFVLHRAAAGSEDQLLERSCMPLDARYCAWRDIPGRTLYLLDVPARRWRSFDLGRRLDEYVVIDPLPLGEPVFALICGRGADAYPFRRRCSIADLRNRRDIYRFEAGNAKAFAARDEQGRPEFRLLVGDGEGHDEARRVSLEGIVRIVDPAARANLGPPGGGLLLPRDDGKASLLLDSGGRPVARLPFPALTCGFGRPSWWDCPVSADARKWLVPVEVPASGNGRDRSVRLALFQLPDRR